MREKDISIAHVYASPSLRCVESACSLLQGNTLLYLLQCKNSIVCKYMVSLLAERELA